MTPEDDGDFSNAPETEANQRSPRRRPWATAGLLVLAVGLAGWLLRKPVAGRVLANWCAGHALSCTAHFQRLGIGGATVGDLLVSGDGQPAFEARRVRVRLDWPGLFTPRVAGIEIDQPVVHGVLEDGQLGFHGLETLLPSGGGGSGGGAIPALDIRDGRILIGSSAGEVGATVSASGTFPQAMQASIELDPARLNEPQGYIKWTGGRADLSLQDGRLEGQAALTLEQVHTDAVLISNADLTATLQAGLGETEGAGLIWDGRIEQASGAGFGLKSLTTSGRAKFDPQAVTSPAALLAALTEADMQLDAGEAHWTGYATGPARIEASLRGQDGAFSGPLDISLSGVSLPQGRADTFAATGDLSWSHEAGFVFAGPVSVSKASLADALTGDILGYLNLPAPLTAHGERLQTAIGRALSGFDAGGPVSVAAAGKGVRIEGQEQAALTAASGLTLTVTPPSGTPWLSVEGAGLKIGGNVVMKGGGAPELQADIRSLSIGADGLALSTGETRLTPWTEAGVLFGADLSSATLQSGEAGVSLNAAGSVSLAGPVFGIDLAPSHLRGGLAIRSGPEGLTVGPAGVPCLTFETGGVGLGDVTFKPATLTLCPRSGSFMEPGQDTAGGTALLGNVSWPFASKSVSGTLSLQDAVLDWSMDRGFAFTVSSPALDLPLNIDDRTLIIDAARPRVSVATASGQVPRLSAQLNDTVLGGTLIPAKVSAGEIRFDGEIGTGGLSGNFAGNSVLIRDFRDDPVYQPLLSDLTARMNEWQLALSGPLRLQANDIPVGDISADINVLTLDGTAHVASRPLDFRKGGLQPVMLSERLRGVYTDAAGQMQAVSDVTISGGQLQGTADVTATGFGFQTTRLGRVENVNGEIRFADLFSLSTEPSQVVTIGGMNPGVPLQDGRIVFQFTNGSVLRIDSAAFPFSGGTLALSPFEWTLGAETQHVEVTADAIDLAKLVETLKLPKVEAEGTVSGRFPIDVERTKVLIDNARLFADPSGGRVAYLGTAADSAAQSDANVRLAFEALKDFDFTVLEVGLDGNIADRVKITLKLAGKSRNDIAYGGVANIVRGQPFEFNIAIDSALAELFRSSQFYTNQQKVTDFVVREVLSDHGSRKSEDEKDE